MRLLKWHVWLGWLIAVPLLLWTASGLFMVSFPIEEVRGTHLRSEPAALSVSAPLVAPRLDARPVDSVMLVQRVDGPVWVLHFPGDDARAASTLTGQILPPVDAALAARIANAALVAPGPIARVGAYAAIDAPIDLRKPRPSWQVHYADGLNVYVDRQTGEVLAVRSRLWRAFDVMWGLHIMDPGGREDTHHPLLVASAALALLSVLLGIWLLVRRQMRKQR